MEKEQKVAIWGGYFFVVQSKKGGGLFGSPPRSDVMSRANMVFSHHLTLPRLTLVDPAADGTTNINDSF